MTKLRWLHKLPCFALTMFLIAGLTVTPVAAVGWYWTSYSLFEDCLKEDIDRLEYPFGDYGYPELWPDQERSEFYVFPELLPKEYNYTENDYESHGNYAVCPPIGSLWHCLCDSRLFADAMRDMITAARGTLNDKKASYNDVRNGVRIAWANLDDDTKLKIAQNTCDEQTLIDFCMLAAFSVEYNGRPSLAALTAQYKDSILDEVKRDIDYPNKIDKTDQERLFTRIVMLFYRSNTGQEYLDYSKEAVLVVAREWYVQGICCISNNMLNVLTTTAPTDDVYLYMKTAIDEAAASFAARVGATDAGTERIRRAVAEAVMPNEVATSLYQMDAPIHSKDETLEEFYYRLTAYEVAWEVAYEAMKDRKDTDACRIVKYADVCNWGIDWGDGDEAARTNNKIAYYSGFNAGLKDGAELGMNHVTIEHYETMEYYAEQSFHYKQISTIGGLVLGAVSLGFNIRGVSISCKQLWWVIQDHKLPQLFDIGDPFSDSESSIEYE